VLLAALLFGTLSQGGLAVNAKVPRELIDVLTAVVILCIATTSKEVRRLLERGLLRRPKASPGPDAPSRAVATSEAAR
jgi:simple sugar transport system permease protein